MLTAIAVKNAKPKEKAYKLFDGFGLFIQVMPHGTKYWRMAYRFNGKQNTLALGVYPVLTLLEAREAREAARKLIAKGVDPAEVKRTQKAAAELIPANSFESIAREWLEKHKHTWTENHARRIMRRLELNVFPYLGKRPIDQITAPELLAVLRRSESRGVLETTHRVRANCSVIFCYAVATGVAQRDIAADLRGAVPPSKKTHFASITDPKRIGNLLRDIDGYDGSFVTRWALQLAPLVFVRPGELRQAEWAEINFEAAEWRIPAERMKMGIMHIVPLSTQALAILREAYALTGADKYVFPSLRTGSRPMSNGTINAALRRMGYAKDEMTGHGFRSMASTLLNEQGFSVDAIERQLAHIDGNSVRRAYNYAQYLPERKRMVQHWADYLGGLKSGADVVTLHQKTA